MSNAPHKAEDRVNVFGIVLIGVASSLLLWATAVALQGYYLNTSGPVETERASMELESVARSVKAQQIANLHRSEENTAYQGSAEACYRNPIEAAMVSIVENIGDGTGSLVPAVGLHNVRTIAPIVGYPDPDGVAAPPAAPVAPTTPTKVKITETNITIDGKIQFETGSARIANESTPLLEEIAAVLAANPRIELVEIAGHTDNVGGINSNTRLSTLRARAVGEYLTNRGVDKKRLDAKGYGPRKPVADNNTDEGRDQNRRVEFVIIKQRATNEVPAATDPSAPGPAPAPDKKGTAPQ